MSILRKVSNSILSVLLVFSLLLGSSVFASATTSNIDLNLTTWIQNLHENNPEFDSWDNYELRFDGNVITPYDELLSHFSIISRRTNDYLGYVICNENFEVYEFSTHSSAYGAFFDSSDMTRGEANAYFEFGFHGIITNGIISDFESLSRSDNEQYDESHNFYDNNQNDTRLTEYYKKVEGVPSYNYCISCIPTAIGNVIGYWDSQGYPNLMTGSYSYMIQEISDAMVSNTANIYIPAAIHSYCHDSGRYPNNFTATNLWNPSFTNFKREIDAGRPALVGFALGNAYYPNEENEGMPHMTTGVGYYYDRFSTDRYIYVHDGWIASHGTEYYVKWTSYNDFICSIIP